MDQEAGVPGRAPAAPPPTTSRARSSSCAAPTARSWPAIAQQPASASALVGPTWLMTAYNNGKQAVVSGVADTEVTAVFGADGQLSGSARLQWFNAPYTVDGDKITIGAPAAHPHDVPAADHGPGSAISGHDPTRRHLCNLQAKGTSLLDPRSAREYAAGDLHAGRPRPLPNRRARLPLCRQRLRFTASTTKDPRALPLPPPPQRMAG